MQETVTACFSERTAPFLNAILLGDRVIVMSGRPGTLREDITVPFPRPRSFDVERSAEFSALRGRIWDLLREDQPAARSAA